MVFRPLDFSHILLSYSLILKLIAENCYLFNLHTIPHNDKAKTGIFVLLTITNNKEIHNISIQTPCYET